MSAIGPYRFWQRMTEALRVIADAFGAGRVTRDGRPAAEHAPDAPSERRGRRIAGPGDPGWPAEAEASELPRPGWVKLPPGERIDELGDFLEWIANAMPEDEREIRAEIKRLFYDVGDIGGGDALNRALSAALAPGIGKEERAAILRQYERYTRADPRENKPFF